VIRLQAPGSREIRLQAPGSRLQGDSGCSLQGARLEGEKKRGRSARGPGRRGSKRMSAAKQTRELVMRVAVRLAALLVGSRSNASLPEAWSLEPGA